MRSNFSQNSERARKAQATGSATTFFNVVPPEVTWVLHAYRKEGDDLVEERPLAGMDVTTLQGVFDQPRDNPMYDAYPVHEAQAKRLQSYVEYPINLRAYDYFVECSAK